MKTLRTSSALASSNAYAAMAVSQSSGQLQKISNVQKAHNSTYGNKSSILVKRKSMRSNDPNKGQKADLLV